MDRAHIIVGFARWPDGSFRPTTGVLFMDGQPDRKLLKTLGFSDVSVVQEVKPESEQPDEMTLYMFEKKPQPNELLMTRLDKNGMPIKPEVVEADPFTKIPPVSGDGVKRYLTPKNGLSSSDFPKKRDSAPPSNRRGEQTNKPDTLPPSSKRGRRQENR